MKKEEERKVKGCVFTSPCASLRIFATTYVAQLADLQITFNNNYLTWKKNNNPMTLYVMI